MVNRQSGYRRVDPESGCKSATGSRHYKLYKQKHRAKAPIAQTPGYEFTPRTACDDKKTTCDVTLVQKNANKSCNCNKTSVNILEPVHGTGCSDSYNFLGLQRRDVILSENISSGKGRPNDFKPFQNTSFVVTKIILKVPNRLD